MIKKSHKTHNYYIDIMDTSQSFEPLYTESANVLILGSMPGLASLEVQEYYAHPRNYFWRIISELTCEPRPLNYKNKLALIYKHNIALWDVLKLCQREGSLDSNIVRESEVANDFSILIKKLPKLERILFNGKKAEQSFMKYVSKTLSTELEGIALIGLPSTSPANASVSFEKKLKQWRVALNINVTGT